MKTSGFLISVQWKEQEMIIGSIWVNKTVTQSPMNGNETATKESVLRLGSVMNVPVTDDNFME